jgi:CheY-like chemotaxis protein
MPTVLCIDDHRESLQIRKLLLETQGYAVLTADNGVVGLKLLAENSVDVVVLDYRMPEMDGLAVATAIRKGHEHLPIVLLTGYPKEPPKQLLDIVDAFMTKGQSPDLLLGELRRLTGGARKPPVRDIVAQTATYLKSKLPLE